MSQRKRRVVIESPLRADTPEKYEFNRKYARACMADCFKRGEAPFASHLLYDQPGILDDTIPEERALGIEAGLEWGRTAEVRVFYHDLGVSPGMLLGVEAAKELDQLCEWRILGEPWSFGYPSYIPTASYLFAFGARGWPGLAKLVEEAGEVIQVCGKLMMTSGRIEHWDGSNLAERLADEIGDVSAAIEFVATYCKELPIGRTAARRREKLNRFLEWHTKGGQTRDA